MDVAWVSRSTFGNVFVDFVPEKTGPTLLGAHKRLFELVGDEIKYLIVSQKISRNFIRKNVGDFEVLAINVDSYKTFVNSFRNQEKRVRLYLFKLSRDEEKIVNDWILAKPKSSREEKITSQEEFLEFLSSMNIDSIKAFSSFIERVSLSLENSISGNLRLYQEKLDKFKEMINDSSVSETTLSKYLHNNRWILDFRYLSLKKCKHQFKTDVGIADIYISREQFEIKKDIIIELKKPRSDLIKTYRGKPAIKAIVGNAISQVINYMEAEKESYKVLNGLLILGRQKEGFIHILNQYFSKIKIVTYEEIAENCQMVLDAFSNKTNKSTVSETV